MQGLRIARVARLILASNSPRRQALLRDAGIEFEVIPSRVEEVAAAGESPDEFARRAARAKALAVARLSLPGSLVLGADTVVTMGGDILGKPSSPEHAAQMLRKLSGATHRVITGVCLVQAPDQIKAIEHETTRVTFRKLEEEEIRAYVASREPLDKAGGYAIQGLASKFITHIDGCYFNVVGLPVPLVYELLRRFSRSP